MKRKLIGENEVMQTRRNSSKLHVLYWGQRSEQSGVVNKYIKHVNNYKYLNSFM